MLLLNLQEVELPGVPNLDPGETIGIEVLLSLGPCLSREVVRDDIVVGPDEGRVGVEPSCCFGDAEHP